jgi:hypothetical protein
MSRLERGIFFISIRHASESWHLCRSFPAHGSRLSAHRSLRLIFIKKWAKIK